MAGPGWRWARAELAQTLQGQRVVFTGYLRGEAQAQAQAYASADVFAFPSVTETFGQVVMRDGGDGERIVGGWV